MCGIYLTPRSAKPTQTLKMSIRVYDRNRERVERIHDKQDSMLSAEDMTRCNALKVAFNTIASTSGALRKGGVEFAVPIPKGTSEAALLCFVYSTRRVDERPILSGQDARGGMKDGGKAVFM